MYVPPTFRSLLTVVFVVVSFSPVLAGAQDASPVAESSVEVVASGLTSPRGMTWGADGTLYVSLAGSGGTSQATEVAPTTNAIGPWQGGPTAAVVTIDENGCPRAVATGLPSSIESTGGVLGADDVAILGDQLYAAVDGGGPVHGHADAPSGIYRIFADGTFELVADLSAWVRANPVAAIPPDFDPDAAGYSVVADPGDEFLWVSDPNSGQILSVTPDGAVSRIADLSEGHRVPTKLAVAPDGGIYVGTLTTVPYPDGAASVLHVAADGTFSEVWTGLTAVTDVAVDADGTLYAIEMSTGNLPEPPFLVPGSGRLVRQVAPDQAEVVADGLLLPVALDIGPDSAFYVSLPSIGSVSGEGMIVRIAAPEAQVAVDVAHAAQCAPIPETLSTGAAPAEDATPAAASQEATAAMGALAS